MMFTDSQAFLASPHKRITLMGMSNVGKTAVARMLPGHEWFHYSIDYRLATAHLRQAMADNLKIEMMKNPILARHLRDDACRIEPNVSFSNLASISHYLGKFGSSDQGGLPKAEFMARQARHRRAEIAAVEDIADFIGRGRTIYGYPHFLCDASGSLCEIVDLSDENDPVLRAITDNTLLVYIEASPDQEARLVERAIRHPKPLYYRPEFLEEAIEQYLRETAPAAAGDVDPDAFVRWVFPRLLRARLPRYAGIARHGCTIASEELRKVDSAEGFLDMVCRAIDRGPERP